MCQAFAAMFSLIRLVNLMLDEEAVVLANKVIVQTPQFGWLHVVEALRAWALLRTGKVDEAAKAVATFSPIPSGSQWGHMNLLIEHAVSGHVNGPDAAGRSLALIAEDLVSRVPQICSDIVAGFAYLRHLAGEEARVEELVTQVAPFAAAVFCQALVADAHGIRPDQYPEFLSAYNEEHPIVERYIIAATEGPRLLAEELERWR
jgi:hypothetical protein